MTDLYGEIKRGRGGYNLGESAPAELELPFTKLMSKSVTP